MAVRHNTGAFERVVRVEGAEEGCGAGKVVDYFHSGLEIVAVAGRGEGVDAGCVLVVFMLPEVGVGAAFGWEKVC